MEDSSEHSKGIILLYYVLLLAETLLKAIVTKLIVLEYQMRKFCESRIASDRIA